MKVLTSRGIVKKHRTFSTHKDIWDYEIQSGLMRDLVNARVEKALKGYEQKAEERHEKCLWKINY